MTLTGDQRRAAAYAWAEMPDVFRGDRLLKALRHRDQNGPRWGNSTSDAPHAYKALLDWCLDTAPTYGGTERVQTTRRLFLALGYFDPLVDPHAPARWWVRDGFRLLVHLEVLPGHCRPAWAAAAYKTLTSAERVHVDAMHDGVGVKMTRCALCRGAGKLIAVG